ncbi:MAG: hypoxanthine phosphoribosyltransferase [Nitrospirae bacterium]|nr:hypoxanthine phosphoribosyltransferase [Nitrospirota bacterium]
MERKFGKALIDSNTLQERVRQLGRQISEDYAGKGIIMIAVLKGAALFYADLIRQIKVPVTLDFVQAKSYAGRTSTGEVRLLSEPEYIDRLAGRHVIVVEDIVDTGVTMQYLRKTLLDKRPASLKVCTLLDKPGHRRSKVKLDYVGFSIPNVFVVGYGMDHNEQFRNLPYLAVLEDVE